jgi:hypothetical protein
MDLKRTLLQNAVHGIADLRQLLLGACARYDAYWKTRGTSRIPPTSRRTVYATDLDYYPAHDTPSFGFDTPVSTVAAFRARMTGAQWHKLDGESQRIWDSLSDAAKEIILSNNSSGNRPSRRDRPGPRSSGGRPSPGYRSRVIPR